MPTYDNGRAPVRVSTLLTDLVNVGGADKRLVRCPEPGCGRWVGVHRHLIDAHRAEDEVARCPTSKQRLVYDLADDEWAARFQGVSRDTDRRRATRVHYKPTPAVPPAVHRIGALRAARPTSPKEPAR
jgi:hypothetical protein